MFDYLERTSLKFHIEEFLQTNLRLSYRIKNYFIDLSQNDGLLQIHIADIFLFSKSCPRPFRKHNSTPYRRTISFHIKDLNFEHLLNDVNWIITEFEQTRKEKNK